MPQARRVALLFDPDALDLRQRETLRGVARYADSAGGWLLCLDPYAHGRSALHCDGIIATSRRGRARSLTHSPVPNVCITWGLGACRLVRVLDDRYAAGRLAARHLAERGCRTFAYLGFAAATQSRVERETFTRELRRRGLRMHRARTFVTYASTRRGWDKVMAALGPWLERLERPVGLFVCRPGFARSVADLALRRGLRIPDELAIVAADDDPLLCELPPALTAIRFDYAEIGRRAAEVLDRLMNGQPPPERNVLVEPSLVPRLSTDRQGTGDPVVARALAFIDAHRTDRVDWRKMEGRCSDRIGPRDVAKAVGLGQRVLEERFRRALGRTVLQELTRARVEHAVIQIEGSNSTMRAIAQECGFGSYPAMLRAFKEHAGKAPKAFRRQGR